MQTMQILILGIFILAIFYAVKFLQKKKVKITEPVPPLLKKYFTGAGPFLSAVE